MLNIHARESNKSNISAVEKYISKEAVVITDQARVYQGILNKWNWRIINHSEKKYVRNKDIYTNSLEGVFSLVKRSLYGIYHKVSPKHLQIYLDEIVFRMNNRNLDNEIIFDIFITNSIYG